MIAFAASRATAVSISGLMIYSTDDFGNPNGYETLNSDQFQAQMWRTMVRSGIPWYGLGVASGLPPASIEDPFLNFPDFSIDVPLDEGENYFTLFAEPGPLTANDDYQRFLINVYFDGNLEDPGLTVLFPRYSEPDGSPVAEARPNDDQWYGLTLQKTSVPPHTFYDDGIHRVSVLRASLLPPERANMSVDRVSAHALSPGGVDGDWVGALVLSVEPSESFGAGGGVPAPFAGSGTGGGRGAGSGSGGPLGGNAGYIPPVPGGQPVGSAQGGGLYDDAGGELEKDDGDVWHSGDPVSRTPADKDDSELNQTPTPGDIVGALEQWLESAGETTPTAGAEDESDVATDGTPPSSATPQSTPTPGTKTPEIKGSTPTVAATAATTPTPGITPPGTRTAPSARPDAGEE
jgi:hypothetical protein